MVAARVGVSARVCGNNTMITAEVRAGLAAAGLSATTRASALTAEQWLSLFAAWSGTAEAPPAGDAGSGRGGRPSAHGYAPGAKAVPRWF